MTIDVPTQREDQVSLAVRRTAKIMSVTQQILIFGLGLGLVFVGVLLAIWRIITAEMGVETLLTSAGGGGTFVGVGIGLIKYSQSRLDTLLKLEERDKDGQPP